MAGPAGVPVGEGGGGAGVVVPGGGAVAVRGGVEPGAVVDPGREVPGPVPVPGLVSVPVPVPPPGGAGVVPGVAVGGRGEGDDVLEVVPLADGFGPSSGTSVTDPDGGTAPFGEEPAPTAA
ncbi:hypothetical protein ACFV9D_10125 [Streptomyces sp. NPDC059875]|uniref:hypothetical protein n=1 Tax=unclassified Streptomyces TaxID=2593676 RepID=UPI003661B0A4